ncbi:dephospho-CoA kinase [Cecembia sp.]|uniref:dephospho-CoA kinase n=1 Tax=Cecembia sp. TaxID=1898110 RepID=UPI0025C6428C|nr:dephospho-CoA kinase [Cecembia sp.]
MKTPKPFLVGITGGIGSGKSTVAKIFSILGIPVYFADERAKWLMANDPLLKKNIIDAFGEESYTDTGLLNRDFLSRYVFGNEERVKLINSLVHPSVRKDFEAWSSKQESPYVLKEAALLFETGSYKELNKIITVSAPLKLRMMRVLLRDSHRNEAQVNAIIDQQLPDEEKNKMADFVIKNPDNKLLIPQVLKVHQELLSLANR